MNKLWCYCYLILMSSCSSDSGSEFIGKVADVVNGLNGRKNTANTSNPSTTHPMPSTGCYEATMSETTTMIAKCPGNPEPQPIPYVTPGLPPVTVPTPDHDECHNASTLEHGRIAFLSFTSSSQCSLSLALVRDHVFNSTLSHDACVLHKRFNKIPEPTICYEMPSVGQSEAVKLTHTHLFVAVGEKVQTLKRLSVSTFDTPVELPYNFGTVEKIIVTRDDNVIIISSLFGAISIVALKPSGESFEKISEQTYSGSVYDIAQDDNVIQLVLSSSLDMPSSPVVADATVREDIQQQVLRNRIQSKVEISTFKDFLEEKAEPTDCSTIFFPPVLSGASYTRILMLGSQGEIESQKIYLAYAGDIPKSAFAIPMSRDLAEVQGWPEFEAVTNYSRVTSRNAYTLDSHSMVGAALLKRNLSSLRMSCEAESYLVQIVRSGFGGFSTLEKIPFEIPSRCPVPL